MQAIYRQAGLAIRRRREEIGISQAQLADMTGCATNTIGYIERGEKTPSVSMLIRVADAMSCYLSIRPDRGVDVIAQEVDHARLG